MQPKKFSLKMEVINDPKEERYSPEEVHFGVPWSLGVERNGKNLTVRLYCDRENDEENPWLIETTFKFQLVSVVGKIMESKSRKCDYTEKKGFGFECLYDWKDAVKGNTANNTAMVYCDVIIKKMEGFAQKRQRSFEKPEENLTDVVLKIGVEKFRVAKMTLAVQSSYFKTLFFGNFDEAKKSEIQLDGVDADTFQLFLEVIYETFKITVKNVEGLLELGYKYDVPLVLERCEKFLLKCKNVTTKKKLRLADAYKLDNLMKSCLNSMSSFQKVKTALPENPIDLSHSSLVALLEKTLSLS